MSNKESIYKGIIRFKLENTNYVIKYIKSKPELLADCRVAGKKGLMTYCFQYARKHNDEFGNRLSLELYDVFWDRVWYWIKD